MSEKIIYSPSVIEFITVAVEYCALVEKLQGVSRRKFLGQITKMLPLIYVKAALLPEIEEGEGLALPEVVTEDDYDYVRRGIWSLLGQHDDYLDVFTADMQFSEAPITCSISEDLADIYQDLKNFVAIYADRNELLMADAIAQVSENFRTYWGQKLVNAMRPLHEITYTQTEDEED
ncbi:MAG: DUF5063 domain-containing protein, partial [Bacteroidales bacterium]|nr:DUF5063 domain-containing protein [Bacteroidales bacterium]